MEIQLIVHYLHNPVDKPACSYCARSNPINLVLIVVEFSAISAEISGLKAAFSGNLGFDKSTENPTV
jgi:hypothetical protein